MRNFLVRSHESGVRSRESGAFKKSLCCPNFQLQTPNSQLRTSSFELCASCLLLVFLALLGAVLVPIPNLHAEDSPVSSVLETAKSLVDVQSVNATVLQGKPQGFIDKATGQILVTQKVRPVGYSRSGSGVIIDPRGIIATNAHTIRSAGSLTVTFFNGMRVPVKEAYLVPGTDLAFLRIEPLFVLSAIPLADTNAAKIGDPVYSIGHSQWLQGTVLGGKLKGVQRRKIDGVSRVTALRLNFDMEKGDSGCPVLNAQGKLLGIVGAGTVGRGNVTLAISSDLIAAALKEYDGHSRPK